MNFPKQLGLSLFIFLAFLLEKDCFAPKHTRSPQRSGRSTLYHFDEPGFVENKGEIEPYPWIDHLKTLGLDPAAVVRRSAIYDQICDLEALDRLKLETAELDNRRAIEKELVLLKIPQIETNRRTAILTFEKRELDAIKATMLGEKNQILIQSRNQIYEKLKLELNFLTQFLSDSGKALAEKCCWDMATLKKQEEINDFYNRNKEFCDKNPDKYEEHKQNLIHNQFSLMKPRLMAQMRDLEIQRDKLKEELLELSCQEF